MILTRAGVAAALAAGFACLTAVPAAAQDDQESVPLIMIKSQSTAAFGSAKVRKMYAAIKKRAGKATRTVLPLTKAEVWSVPKKNVGAVQKAASRYGAAMQQLNASWNHVFQKLRADTRLTARQRAIADNARSSAAVVAVGTLAAPPPPMVEYALIKDAGSANAAKITVEVGDQTTLSLTRVGLEIKSDMCIWRGTVDGTGEPATILWWPGGRMAGTVQHQGRIYSIRPMGGEAHAVVALAEERLPKEHAAAPARLRSNDPSLRDDPLINLGDASILKSTAASAAPRPNAPPAAAAQPGDVVIDVIIAYTKKAASSYADIKRELVELAIEEGNESFRLSNLANVKLRLVHAYETDYVEEGAHFDHVWRLADKGDGHMEEIHALRDKHKADVAILIVDDAQGCGLATRVFADADEAFAVVHHECAATTYTVAHEIGHLIGARHDLSLDKVMTPFPYGHGYVNGSKWRDIMSYREACGGCPRIPVWSSPKVLVKGEPAGTPDLDNARVIAEQAARVAAFR
jgi:hypothetical protein